VSMMRCTFLRLYVSGKITFVKGTEYRLEYCERQKIRRVVS
jgi:predicted metalloprotease